MYISAAVLELSACESGFLPESHGRLLHAAFLNYICACDNSLSKRLHDESSKSFSLSELAMKVKPVNKVYKISSGLKARWRICALGDVVGEVLSCLKIGESIRVGKINFKIDDIFCSPELFPGTGVTSSDELRDYCASASAADRVTIGFMSPASFRVDDKDYPFPKPELVFGSLADRWNRVEGEQVYDTGKIKEIASAYLIPDNWKGETRRVYFGKGREFTRFTGSFSYRLNLLPPEYRVLFAVLAEFGSYAGVGRLTAQGLGQVCVRWQ